MNIDQERAEAARLKASGLSRAEIADAMGISIHAVKRRLRQQDGAVEAAMAAVGTGMVPSTVWVKTGTHSVMLRPAADDPATMADNIRETLEGLPAIAPVPCPEHTLDQLCTVYTLADVHIGMLAWQDETGESYDTEKASDRVRKWVSYCVDQSPASDEAVILDVGDLTHADDQTNQTRASGHVLDVDTRHYKTQDVTIETIAAAVEIALTKHRRVRVRIMRGNHNPHAYIGIMFALSERYRNNPRVEIERTPMDFFAMQWGSCMIASHHGDKAKAAGLILEMADRYAGMWGQTRYRYLFTGHMHHHKSQDIGGVRWEQLSSVSPKDAYAASYPFSGRADMQSITYHKERGEISRVRVSNWME